MTRLFDPTYDTMLVVGEPHLAQALTGRWGGGVHTADDYLDALGAMAHVNIGAVVGAVEPLICSIEQTARSLRDMAPAAAMILVCGAGEEPLAIEAVGAGFDDYVVRPLEDGDVLEAIQSARRDEPGPSAVGAGDDALVQMLLDGQAGVSEHALALIQQRLGTVDVRLVGAAIDGGVSVAVPESGGLFLVSSTCSSAQLEPHAAWLARWSGLAQRVQGLQDQAWRDPLTGAWNRRYFFEQLGRRLAQAHEQRTTVTVMVYDIDGFKGFNDRFGHPVGDRVLVETATLMRGLVRTDDVVARIGGDEFAVMFLDSATTRGAGSNGPAATAITRRFQEAVRRNELAPGRLTISAGLASYPWDGTGPDPAALLKLADDNLLASKRQGKDRLTLGGSEA